MDLHPLFVSPALPPDLLWFIIHSCTYPTTLIVCSSRDDFLASLTQSMLISTDHEKKQDVEQDEKKRQHSLLGVAPLYQLAVARHLRIVFVPTVSHLRAYLSVFSADDSKVPAPPSSVGGSVSQTTIRCPLLLLYGFLDMHRETSEWSVQGLSNTSSILVETAKRVGFRAVVLERKVDREHGEEDREEKEQSRETTDFSKILAEKVPILSGSAIRSGPDLKGSGWAGRTVTIRQVLGRWFLFRPEDLGKREF